MTAPTQVLLVGTMHFVSRRDLVTYDVFDVASTSMQEQILDLVERLARYEPTKVVLELAYAERDEINERDSAFRRASTISTSVRPSRSGSGWPRALATRASIRSTSCTAGGNPRWIR